MYVNIKQREIRVMKYYVYSDDTGNGDFAETMEEAMKIAQEYATSEYEVCENSIKIYKLYQTLESKTTITFNVIKEK